MRNAVFQRDVLCPEAAAAAAVCHVAAATALISAGMESPESAIEPSTRSRLESLSHNYWVSRGVEVRDAQLAVAPEINRRPSAMQNIRLREPTDELIIMR